MADGAKVIIVNIYSPCDVGMKRNLWDQIRQLRNADLGGSKYTMEVHINKSR